jgi:tetratricopeptide (TPR) repeat protein
MRNVQSEYSLQQDNTANTQIKELESKLFSQICLNGQNEVDALVNLGKIQEQNKNYIQADAEYQKAIQKTSQYPECTLNLSAAQERKSKIQSAVTYQNSMNEIENLYKNARFSELINKYISATSQWQADNIKITFGLNHLTLLEYTQQKNNPDMMITVANHLLDQNNPDFTNSMQLLKTALNNQVDVRSTTALQERLGVFYAKNDHKNNNAVNGKTQIVQHTGNDKRLKAFSKSYTNTLKGLQKK